MANAAPSVLHLPDKLAEGRRVRRGKCASSCARITLLYSLQVASIPLYEGQHEAMQRQTLLFNAGLHFVITVFTFFITFLIAF